MSAKTTRQLSPKELAKKQLKTGEELAARRKINGGYTYRYDIMRGTSHIGRIEVTDGVATRYSLEAQTRRS